MPRQGAFGRWLPVLGWAALISLLSTGWFSGEHTAAVLTRVVLAVFPDLSLTTLHKVHQGLRKAAHFSEYFVLSLLLYRALRNGPGWSPRAALLAVAVAGLYAIADELHQHFAPGRVAAAADCLIDFSGAIAAQGLVAARERAAVMAGAESAR